jgi:hypothetical protein
MVSHNIKSGDWQLDVLEIVRDINNDMTKRIDRQTIKMPNWGAIYIVISPSVSL